MKFFWLILFCFHFAGAADWTREALHLTGESPATRARALRRLEAIPHLRETLRRQIEGPRRGLALDVISALQMESLLPDLLQAAAEDRSGFIYLTVNNLIDQGSQARLFELYTQRLFCHPDCAPSPAAQVILLDTLGRVGHRLSIFSLRRLYREAAWPEVRMAIVGYIRYAILHFDRENYIALLRSSLGDRNIQVREQSLYLLSELPPRIRRILFLTSAAPCESFTPSSRPLCEKMRAEAE